MAEKGRVGLTYINAVVTGPAGQRTVRFLIDSGASYSLLPHELWRAIGLVRMRTHAFYLADNTKIERDVSECFIELPTIDDEKPRGHTPVILGQPGDVAVLGVVTMENLGVVFNPFDRSLRRQMAFPLMRASA
jgi:predicted aspartyl protease